MLQPAQKKIDMDPKYDEIITKFDLFTGYTPHGARRLLEQGEIRSLEADEPLIREGDAPNSADLVIEGRLDVFVTRDGTDMTLATVGPGSILGELGVLCGIPRAASVKALEPSVVVQWNAAQFRRMLLGDVMLSERIFRQSLRMLIDNERSMIDELVKSKRAGNR
jgi:CRP-like cAMP-binding protein